MTTAESNSSRLVGLPPELQITIWANLSVRHLNKLSQTCKALHAAVLPKLYKKIIICVPQRWSRLESLESLIGSTGTGPKHTTELIISVQQDPLREGQQGSEDDRPQTELSERSLQFDFPQGSASNALNAFIRLLILKLPQNRLDLFGWGHGCELDASTMSLLFKRHKTSLRRFFCNRYSSSCDTSGSVLKGIRNLFFESMDTDRGGCLWAAQMLVENSETLERLMLGFSTRIAHDYALNKRTRYHKMSTSFVADVKKALSKSNLEPSIHLSLGSLRSLALSGLDLRSVIREKMTFDLDFSNISQLRLESCPDLNQAFSLFTGQGGSPKLALGALQDLFLRIEHPDPDFSPSLESFLTSIHGLSRLQVLIDKASTVQDLEPILRIHGKTLNLLVWDERRGRRTQLDVSTSLLPSNSGNLGVIATYCPSLKILGIPLDWEAISIPDKCRKQIGRLLRWMPKLEVLMIRNLPELRGDIPSLPMDYLVKSVAAMFIDFVNTKRKSTSIDFIALGAPLYTDINIGTHHVTHTPVSDFLCFRVYKIDYKYPSPNGLSTVLSEVVKGAAVSAEGSFEHEHLLNDYWLG